MPKSTTDPGGTAYYPTPGGGGGGVNVEDEGVAVNTASTLNFIGNGVKATDAGGGVADITIPGIAGAGVTAYLPVLPIFWWSADALALADGDPVPSWVDLSGNEWNAAQVTAGKQPVYRAAPAGFHGKPAVQFNEGNHSQLVVPYDAILNPTDMTIFMVLQPTDVLTNGHFPLSSGGPPGNGASFEHGYQIILSSTTPGLFYLQLWDGVSDNAILAGLVQPDGVTRWASVDMDSTPRGQGYVDGVPHGGADQFGGISVNPSEDMWIGAGGTLFQGILYYDGYIAEIIGYNTRLTNAQRHRVDTYIQEKYGL